MLTVMQCQKEGNCYQYCAPLWHLRWGLPVTDCQQGMKPWSTVFNLNASSCLHSGVMWHPQSTGNWRACHQVGEIRLQSFGMRKVLYLGICHLGGKFRISPLHQICTTRIKCALYSSQTTPGCTQRVHTTGAFTHFGWTVLPSQRYSPESGPSEYHVFGPLETSQWQGTAECLAPGMAEEGEQPLLGGNACCCLEVEENCWWKWRRQYDK